MTSEYGTTTLSSTERTSPYLRKKNRNDDQPHPIRIRRVATAMAWVALGCTLLLGSSNWIRKGSMLTTEHLTSKTHTIPFDKAQYPLEGHSKHKDKHKHHHEKDDDDDDHDDDGIHHHHNKTTWKLPEPQRRCDWVIPLMTEADIDSDDDGLRAKYLAQSIDANVFYRATARLFWLDVVPGKWWGNVSFEDIGIARPTHADGTPLERKATWTWVTGDQHLSNFGAWRNRHGDVVFSVNDFDEAALFDFHIDVLRVAVSICSHAFTNGLPKHKIKKALHAFTETYIDTVASYIGNENALLYELTPETATGKLQEFLRGVNDDNTPYAQLEQFTEVDAAGVRRFIMSKSTKLYPVSPEVEGKIRDAISFDRYGATMTKIGWHVHDWDDDYFQVLDIAARIGSGVGSYGVDRFYVLLKGTDALIKADNGYDGNSVILDVKYEPHPAVHRVLNPTDAAWYNVRFANSAARAVEAQRRLTSYTDPFTGWIILDDQPFLIRQRSPWKDSPDLNELEDVDEFVHFIQQVGVATATSHVRGSIANESPLQFKKIINKVLNNHWNRKKWSKAVAQFAFGYRGQVMLDFECFQDFVNTTYGNSTA